MKHRIQRVQLFVVGLALACVAACFPPVQPAVTAKVEPARAGECEAGCRALGMRLTSMVLIMNHAGCVCELPAAASPAVPPPPGAAASPAGAAGPGAAAAPAERGASAAAGGAMIGYILAEEAAAASRRQQQSQQPVSHPPVYQPHR